MIKCRLKMLLAEHDINQKEFAEATGIQVNTISKMCRNEIRQIPVDAFGRYVFILQVPTV